MIPEHTDPTEFRRHVLDKDSGDFIDVQSRAPYNFVPIPEKMVEAQRPLPSSGVYVSNTLTGWIECKLETCSPVYVRGMLTDTQFKEFGQKSADQLTSEEKEARAHFYSYENGGGPTPVIPGSSLRGMIRSLVEVIAYGRMRWVSASPTFTYRAVAAESQDPLRNPYRKAIKDKVKAGYFKKIGEDWFIQPAKTPKESGFNKNRDPYIKIDDADIKNLPGFVHIGAKDYCPQIYEIGFDDNGPRVPTKKNPGKNRKSYNVGIKDGKFLYKGVLVCSGDMNETGEERKGKSETNRAKHYIFMPPKLEAKPIPVPDQVIQDYLAGMTKFQKEELNAWHKMDDGRLADTPEKLANAQGRTQELNQKWGCLSDGKPVFYVTDEDDEDEKALFFGHSPNFRIPAQLMGKNRAATPLDFVPECLRLNPYPDIADAIFGWTEEENWGPEGQRAGRVFFEDAHFVSASEKGVWYDQNSTIPKVLASPKVTTFQHYLVQDKTIGHNSDKRATLAHYGMSPQETKIRGQKFYWHKGVDPDFTADPEEEKEHPTQFTRIKPVNPGVCFSFKINFENLRREELGALWWALTLPGGAPEGYRHKIGMGKPLGLGSVLVAPALYLSTRRGSDNSKSRYDQLLAEGKWFMPFKAVDGNEYLEAFEKFVLKDNQIASDKQHLSDVERIRALLEILKWRGDDPDSEWLETTRYMEIEHSADHDGKEIKYNEYKSRPVLPGPFGLLSKLTPSRPEEDVQRIEKRDFKRPDQRTPQKDESTNNDGLKTGTVKWYNRGDFGYHGYIQPEGGGEDVHVDEKHLKDKSARLKQGQRVRFSVWYNKKNKPNAADVEILADK
jgi:CRISPR-associated protein (TIGR03986 family)